MSRKILIIDDDPGIQDLLAMIFRKAGYTVFVESNGQEIMKGNYELPDIFLLDRQLSGADGLLVCDFLKHTAKTKNIPVIMVSASPDIKDLSELAGADDFIEKPFNIKDILKLVESHIGPVS